MTRAHSKVMVYACAKHHSDGTCPAPAAITLRLLDEHVETIALAELEWMRARAPVDDTPLRDARAAVKVAESELSAFLAGVQAAGLAPGQFATAARERGEMVEAARGALAVLLADQGPSLAAGDPVALWESLDESERNHLLCGLFEVVLVGRAGGRGHVVPVESRVRVIRYGAGMVDTTRFRGRARRVESIGLPDLDDPRVLRVPATQDDL